MGYIKKGLIMNTIKIKYIFFIGLLSITFVTLPLSRRVFNEQLTDKLFAAIKKGDKNEVATLLNKGANPNAKQAKKTALMLAITLTITDKKAPADIIAAREAIVEALLKHGADANTIDSSLMTPLELATYYEKDPKVVSLLIQYGARITPRVNLEYTPGQKKINKTDPYELARKELKEWEIIPSKEELAENAEQSTWRNPWEVVKYYLGY